MQPETRFFLHKKDQNAELFSAKHGLPHNLVIPASVTTIIEKEEIEMALLGNLFWFLLGGWWNFLLYAALGLFFCMTIIGIPIGKALFQYAKLMALPFGKVIVTETELKGKENVAAVRRAGGTIANILWLPFGIFALLANLGLMIVCAISIIGIPVAIVLAKSCKFLLWPVGAKVITQEEYNYMLLRRAFASSGNAAPCATATSIPHTTTNQTYKVEDFFSKPAFIGVGIALGVICFFQLFPPIGDGPSPNRSMVLLPIAGIVILVTLALLISWICSKIGSTAFWGISFSSAQDFFRSVQDLFITLLNDLPFLRVVFAIIFFFFCGGVPVMIGLLIGATIQRNSRSPVTPVSTVTASENTFSANQPDYQYQQPPIAAPAPTTSSSPSVLVENSRTLWMSGLPIAVTRSDIAKTSQNSTDVSLLLAFQNLCDQPIIGVYFSARCSNILHQELEAMPRQSVQDFTLNPGEVWTAQHPIPIPSNDTRRIELVVHNIVMADGSIWNNDEAIFLSPIQEQQPLDPSDKLHSELRRIASQHSGTDPYACNTSVPYPYIPNRGEGYWCCACGQVNLSSKCLKCGIPEEPVFQATYETHIERRKRTEVVFVQSNAALWMPDLPILVTKSDIVKQSSDSSELSLSIAFQNLAGQPINAVIFNVRCLNILNQELQSPENQFIQDLVLEPGAVWESPLSIPLPNNDTRKIELIIHKVVMADGSIWSNDENTVLTPVQDPTPMTLPVELHAQLQRIKKQFFESSGKEAVPFLYVPSKSEGYWRCSCGQINLSSACLKCGIPEETVFQITQTQFLAEARENQLN